MLHCFCLKNLVEMYLPDFQKHDIGSVCKICFRFAVTIFEWTEPMQRLLCSVVLGHIAFLCMEFLNHSSLGAEVKN